MKNINSIILLCVVLISFQHISYAQKHEKEVENESAIEIITSGLVSYSPSEKESLYGTEIHVTYWFNPIWGAGISYGSKFTHDIVLSDVALLGSYNATPWLTLNSGMNFALSKEDYREETNIGFYAEAEFNWRLSKTFHFGILTGTVLSKETELTAGIQLGFEFPTNKNKRIVD